MSFDILLVTGSILAVLSLVSILNALIEKRRPRVASVVVVISGGMLVVAAGRARDGFQFSDIPNAYINVIAMILN